MDFWDDDMELMNGYEQMEQNVEQSLVKGALASVSGGGESLNVQPIVGISVTDSIGGMSSSLIAARGPEKLDGLVEMSNVLNSNRLTLLKSGLADSGMALTRNSFFSSNMSGRFSLNPNLTKLFVDKVQYNFETYIGPTNIACVPSELTEWEADNGFYLLPDDFGIDRKYKNDTMVPDDFDKVLRLESVFEKAAHDAFNEVQGSKDSSVPSFNDMSGFETAQTRGNSDNKLSSVNNLKEKLTTDNILDTIKELLTQGVHEIIIDGQHIDLKRWNERYNEIYKKINDLLQETGGERFNLLNNNRSNVKNLVATGKFTVTSMDYNNFEFGYDPFPFFPLTPKGTQDYYFSRSGKNAYHMIAADALDLVPTTVEILVITNPGFWELQPYYKTIKPVVSAVCEVEKNMHLHWEEVERGDYTYLNAIKESLLPLGLDLGPVGYTAKNVSNAIAQKYGLPETVKPALEYVLSKIMVNMMESAAQI